MSLEYATPGCLAKIAFNESFEAGAVLRGLTLTPTLKCSLKGRKEEFVVLIDPPSLLPDLFGNNLSTGVVKGRAVGFSYMSESDKAVIEGSGSMFSLSGIITFGMICAMILFQ